MANYFTIWLKVFLILLIIAGIGLYIWMRMQINKKQKSVREKGKSYNYSLKQMKEIK